MSEAHATPRLTLQRGSFPRYLAALATLVALADFLFYGHNIGLSAAIFVLCTGLAASLTQPNAPTSRRVLTANTALCLAAAPSLAGFGTLAILFALTGTAYAATALNGGPPSGTWRILRGIFWRLIPDAIDAAITAENSLPRLLNPIFLLGWIIPLGFGALFLMLFSAANPIIAATLDLINPWIILDAISLNRVLFWAFSALFIWPFIARQTTKTRPLKPIAPATQSRVRDLLFGRAAMLRALILFNLLFAIQTALDITYLWLGAKLPAGLTYADYAHRGAYPLIVTALLAGAFAALATRPGAATSSTIQALVLPWIAQNILLVTSAMLRLALYIQAYSLTELRLAALIWMLLTATGLTLILARILLRRPNIWLLRANFLALAATLYVCAFPNFPGFIAMYNVRHCAQITGAGPPLDLAYLQSLGPQAIPALDLYEHATPQSPNASHCIFPQSGPTGGVRTQLYISFTTTPTTWRNWTFWHWALSAYLTAHQTKC